MNFRLWSGAAALMMLSACGGAATTSTTTTAPATQATTGSMATTLPVDPATTATPAMMATATPAMMETMGAMDMTTTPDMTTTTTRDTMATTGATDSTAVASSGDQAAREAILAALQKQVTGGPYRTETTIESGGQTSTIEGEFVPPGRMRATTSANGQGTEIVIVDDRMWTKTGDTWTEVPGGGEQVQQMMSMIGNPEASGLQINNAQMAGTEDVDGVTANVYTYESVYGTGEQQATSNSKLWVDASSGLPIRAEGTTTVEGVETRIVQAMTYDDSITIEAPAQ